jgi:hypothetical protein
MSLSELNNTNQSLNITDEIIVRYKIGENTHHTTIKIYITKHILNMIFENLIKTNSITKENNLYIVQHYKTTKMDIINYIIKYHINKNKFKTLTCYLFTNIIQSFQIKKNELETIQNIKKIKNIKKNMETLLEKKDKISRDINEQNTQYMETVYKQNRLEIQMENEMYEQEFKKTNIGAQYETIKQQYQSHIQSKMSQIAKRNGQINTLNYNRVLNRQNIDKLEQQVLQTIITHKNEKAMIDQLEQTNILQKKILDESISFRRDLNDSFQNIINSMKEQNDALITSINTTSDATRDVVIKSSEDTQSAIKQSGLDIQESIKVQSSAIQQSIIDSAKSTNDKLTQLNSIIMDNNTQIVALNAKVDALFQNIGQLHISATQAAAAQAAAAQAAQAAQAAAARASQTASYYQPAASASTSGYQKDPSHKYLNYNEWKKQETEKRIHQFKRDNADDGLTPQEISRRFNNLLWEEWEGKKRTQWERHGRQQFGEDDEEDKNYLDFGTEDWPRS